MAAKIPFSAQIQTKITRFLSPPQPDTSPAPSFNTYFNRRRNVIGRKDDTTQGLIYAGSLYNFSP